MTGNTTHDLAKCRFRGSLVAAVECVAPLRVPGGRAAFACVQMSGLLELQFAVEMTFGSGSVTLTQAKGAGEPMPADATEHGAIRLVVLRRGSRVQFAVGSIERLPRNVDARRQPVRERQPRHQLQSTLR